MVRLNPRSIRVLDQNGEPDVMQSVEGVDHVGAFLKEAREVTGKSVADVAQTLRIRRVYLEAIEDGRFDELPGAAYAVGFIRSYATYLRLDVPETVARFKSELQGTETDQQLDFPTPVPEGRFPGGVVVTLCLLIAAAGFGGWYWWQDQKNVEVVRVPAPPQEVLTGSSHPAPIATGRPSATSAAQTTAPDEPVTETSAASAPEVAVEVNTPAPEEVVASVEAAATDAVPVNETAVPAIAEESPALTGDSLPAATQVDTPDAGSAVEAGIATRDTVVVSQDDTVEVAEVSPVTQGAEPQEAEPQEAAVVAESPVETSAPVTAEDSVAVTSPTSSTPPAQPTGPNSDLNVGVAVPPEPSEPAAANQTASLPAIPATPSVSGTQDEARTYGTVNRDARIVVSAVDADTWVQVMDSQENALLTQMLRPGDKYLVPNRPGLSLRTNNAGGLEIQVDGVAVPAIGARGDIRRDVRLDPDLLKSGTAVAQ